MTALETNDGSNPMIPGMGKKKGYMNFLAPLLTAGLGAGIGALAAKNNRGKGAMMGGLLGLLGPQLMKRQGMPGQQGGGTFVNFQRPKPDWDGPNTTTLAGGGVEEGGGSNRITDGMNLEEAGGGLDIITAAMTFAETGQHPRFPEEVLQAFDQELY